VRVLVTGCAGYVGSVLTDYLLRCGHEVVGVDSLMYGQWEALTPYLGRPHFAFVKEDVQNYLPLNNLARSCDAAVLLAAAVGAPACERNPEYAVAVNHWAVANLVENLLPWQRVVYPNTNSGYGTTAGETPCTEETPLAPISVYGGTKCAGELAVLRHPLGVSLRLATAFGVSPRMRLDLMVNDFAARLVRDERLEVFEPHFKRNFVHVRDVARAVVFFLDWNNRGLSGAFNVGLPDANLTKLELAHLACDELGLPRSCVSVGEGRDPDRRNYLVSNDKLLRAGFHFQHDLPGGIQDVAAVASEMSGPAVQRARNV
jgi:nucleoside-diphosphate-sugar epimerase